MSDTANSEATPTPNESEKPALVSDDVKFPPFPDPKDADFDEDLSTEETNYYKNKFSDLNAIKSMRLHCTACDRHLGCSARNEARMRSHPMLRTLMCHTCHSFYNSGEFEKGDDGSELYCRWCGQGGQVYCCSDCEHVFCAKCIKRNLGLPKIKEIENTDDWKCFKCNPKCLWDLRAVCWALLRYCDLKNKVLFATEDPELKELYQKDCAKDHSECCRSKYNRKKEKVDTKKKDAENTAKKDAENSAKKDAENSAKKAASIISKFPPTIQVKKFASINLEDSPKQDKKIFKRSMSPKLKSSFIKTPMAIAPCGSMTNQINMPSMPKKLRMASAPMINPIRFQKDRAPVATYTRIRPKPPPVPIILNNQYNGFNNPAMYNNMVVGDNINLSLENLTQGLDMTAVAQLSQSTQNDDVVCTPDFPMEPLCEVTEDNTDDDVQCITPGPVVPPKVNTGPPPLVPRLSNALNDLSSENIIQMTENDVTVNAATGGLKFRVDPQTLSSNKMYRLPDGRIFAINSNPSMPGGYSATIVAVTENTSVKPAQKGATYAAKLNAISSQVPTPSTKPNRIPASRTSTSKNSTKTTKAAKVTESPRECDLNVPVEWYRYNLIDAVDALEYSLSRLNKLKKEATTVYLRTRNVNEMRGLHKNLERLLNTSSARFNEIRDNLKKGLKQYIVKKIGGSTNVSDDDDDVEILNDLDNDDPIFIDENSNDSNLNDTSVHDTNMNDTSRNNTQEVDLTLASSDQNESGGKSSNQNESFDKDPLVNNDLNTESFTNKNRKSSAKENLMNSDNENEDDKESVEQKNEDENSLTQNDLNTEKTIEPPKNEEAKISDEINKTNGNIHGKEDDKQINDCKKINEKVKDIDLTKSNKQDCNVSMNKTENSNEKFQDIEMNEDKSQDVEMSEELIETLLKEDSGGGDADNS